MFKPHYGECKECGKSPRLIATKRGLCKSCDKGKSKPNSDNSNRGKASNKQISRSGVISRKKNLRRVATDVKATRGTGTTKNKKPTGELELFKKIYEERGPYSQVAPFDEVPFDVRCFSHILSKGAYPSERLNPDNIVIKTPAQHDMWHNKYHELKALPEWQWVLKKEQELKEEYYRKNKVTKK